MKRIFLLLVFLSCAAFAGDLKEITVEEFKSFAKQNMGTMTYYEFSGIQDGKAILIHQEMSSFSKRWTQTKYWVPSSSLSTEYIKSLTVSDETDS